MIRKPSEKNLFDFWSASRTHILWRAEDGVPAAQNAVGHMYLNASPPDLVRADTYFILAGVQGHWNAGISHNRLAMKLTPDQRAEAWRPAQEWQARLEKEYKARPRVATALPKR